MISNDVLFQVTDNNSRRDIPRITSSLPVHQLFRCMLLLIYALVHPLMSTTTVAATSRDGSVLNSPSAVAVAPGFFQHHALRLQLGLGVRGRIECPAEPDPPTTLIVWMKDGSGVIDTEDDASPAARSHPSTERLTTTGDNRGGKVAATTVTTVVSEQHRDGRLTTDEATGALIVDPVTRSDEGTYRCTAYSPLDNSRTSYPIRVIVKGNLPPGHGSGTEPRSGLLDVHTNLFTSF